MIILFQLLFSLVAFVALGGIASRRSKGQLRSSEAVFWFIFWVGGLVVVLWPESAAKLAGIFGIGRGADFIVYVAVAALFYLVFRLHLKIELLNRDITAVTRERAIEEEREH